MRRNRFRPGDDAVSSVVGVVLLVGIAVMLMTTLSVFVLGFGPGDQTPEAELQFYQEAGDDNVTITVVDAADIEPNEITVTVDGDDACYKSTDPWADSDTLEAGATVTIDETSPPSSCSSATDIDSNSTVTVIWESSSGGRSEVVDEYVTA